MNGFRKTIKLGYVFGVGGIEFDNEKKNVYHR